jgi:two-component system CheB/CheR fusion protein
MRPDLSGEPRRILVVDDCVDAADCLSMLLRMIGHEVQTAHDGLLALELAQSYVAEVVFIDLGMPRIDGWELARRLRALPKWGEAVLIALTGHGGEEARRRCFEAGFDHFLLKPADLNTLQHLLTQSRVHGPRIASPDAEPAQPRPAGPLA